MYRFKAKDGSFLPVRSTCFSFRNPWTKEVEFIVSSNTVVPMEEVTSSCQDYDSAGGVSLDAESSTGTEINAANSSFEKLHVPGLPGGTKPGAGRIGRQIADEMFDCARGSRSPQVVDSTNTDLFDSQMSTTTMPSTQAQSMSVTLPNMSASTSSSSVLTAHGPNGINVASSAMDGHHHDSSLLDTVIEEQEINSISNPTGTDEGDEVAMSMIMSLLEADAGLGGPIDFNDLPWPL